MLAHRLFAAAHGLRNCVPGQQTFLSSYGAAPNR